MSSLKSLLYDHNWMYTKRGGVAVCRVVCIWLYLKSFRVYVFQLVLWTTQSSTALARIRTLGRSSSITRYKQHDILPHHHAYYKSNCGHIIMILASTL